MKIVCLEAISSKGLKEVNEDSLYCDSKIAMVVDGASSLAESRGESSARWLVDRFVRYVVSSYDDGVSLKELVREAINRVVESYVREYGEPVEDRAFWPSASASIILVRGEYLEYMVFGDSPIILYPKASEPIVVRDYRLVQLDEEVVRLIHRHIVDGMEFSQVYREVLPVLRKHRRMLCTPEGYAAISLDIACVEHALYGRVRAEELEYVIMSTDGFMRIVDVFRYIEDYETLLSEALSKGLASLLVKLRELEYRDRMCRKYPRLSISDDATSLLLRID